MNAAIRPDHVLAVDARDDDALDDDALAAMLRRTVRSLDEALEPISSPWSRHWRDAGRIEFARAVRPARTASVVHMRLTRGCDQSVGIGLHRPGRTAIVTLNAPVGVDLSSVSPSRRADGRKAARLRATALVDLLRRLASRAIDDLTDPEPARVAALWATAVDPIARPALDARPDADVEILEAPTPWGPGALRVRPLGRDSSRVLLGAVRPDEPTLLEARLYDGSIELQCDFGPCRIDLPEDPVSTLDAMRAAAGLGRARHRVRPPLEGKGAEAP